MRRRPGARPAAAALALGLVCAPLALAPAARPAAAGPEHVGLLCPAYADPVVGPTPPAEAELEEVSGLAASRAHPGVLWAIADSGNDAALVAVAEADGALLGRWVLDPPADLNVDWEDLAIGPGPGGEDHLYVGDVGDNLAVRPQVEVYRVPEPDVDPDEPAGEVVVPAAGFDRIDVASSPSVDRETLLHDPVTGDLFLLGKASLADPGPAPIHRVALADQEPGETVHPELVGTLDVSDATAGFDSAFPALTGGDVSADGSLVVLRTMDRAWAFPRAAGETIDEALQGPPCPLPLDPSEAPPAGQGEAIALASGADRFVTESEGTATRPLYTATSCLVEAEEAGSPPFPDVPVAFTEAVGYLGCAEITTGYPDGTFRPAGSLNRAQLAAFLHRAAGSRPPADPEPDFADVAPDHPFAADIAWLAERGITTGYGDGTFRPGTTVNRAQIATFLHRFAGEVPPADPEPAFTDVAGDHPFAVHIAWLAEQGISEGWPDGTFRPTNPVSRGATTAFLHRLARLA